MVRARTRSNINLAGRADRLAAAARGKSPFLPPFPFFYPTFVFLPRPPFFYPALRFFTPPSVFLPLKIIRGSGKTIKGVKTGIYPVLQATSYLTEGEGVQ